MHLWLYWLIMLGLGVVGLLVGQRWFFVLMLVAIFGLICSKLDETLGPAR